MPQDKRPKLADFGTRSIAEQKIINEIHLGEFITIGTGKRPEERTGENSVRAELARFLDLGGSENLRPIDAAIVYSGCKEVLATIKLEVFGNRSVKSLQPAPGSQGLGVVEW